VPAAIGNQARSGMGYLTQLCGFDQRSVARAESPD
jgi:hypothetical protein